MNNLEIYNQVAEVPKEAQKPIKGGRLNGKTDINPMWRIMILTELFGIVGFGWKYEIVRSWIEQGAKGAISAFIQINLFVKYNGQWSEAIPGLGGSSFVAIEGSGLYTSDECYKMALTDAISVACKALGIGANVYWQEGSKYLTGNITDHATDKTENTDKKTVLSPASKKLFKDEYIDTEKLMQWIRNNEEKAQKSKQRFSLYGMLEANYTITEDQKAKVFQNYQRYKINNNLL